MSGPRWQAVERLGALLRAPPLDPVQHESRLKAFERDLVLPVKLVIIGVLVWFFWHGYHGDWFNRLSQDTSPKASERVHESTNAHRASARPHTPGTPQEPRLNSRQDKIPRAYVVDVVEGFFYCYLALNVVVSAVLILPRRWPFRLHQWIVWSASFVDGVFVAALTLVTGGFNSMLYWLFPVLIVRNALGVPFARPQIVLNLAVALIYVVSGAIDYVVTLEDLARLDPNTAHLLDIAPPQNFNSTVITRLIILLLLTACCYGLQVLLENERRKAEERRESASRQEQLRTAGRLAAEIAHKIKNPLGIINNAAFAIQRAVENDQRPPTAQIQIIREEVERSDRILTELMGYAQLAEGRVEKLNVVEEMNRAIMTAFPPGARYSVQVHTDFAADLPPLLMQRNHFSELVVNILLNAREALSGLGQIFVRAWTRNDTVFISIKDDGPGIPPEKLERVFESYFSTKEKGTGLGLAIVRHHAEMYQGSVRAESKPGEGATFIIELPTRTFMKNTQ
jgi:signal transduction histidine kinase